MAMASPSSRSQTSPRSYSSAFASTSATNFSHRTNSKQGRRSMTVTSKSEKRTCMCSPTTHPGSFRCAYHKQVASWSGRKPNLVRIGGVEGELARRALATLIRPSSHHLRRRQPFQPRPTRLSLMSKAQPQDHSF